MDFFNKELYEQGLKFQKNMMDQYMDAVNTFTGHFTAGSEKKADDSKKNNFFDAASVMNNFTESMSVYTKLFDFWKDYAENLTEYAKDPGSAMEKYREKADEFMDEFTEKILKPVMPEDVFKVIESCTNLSENMESAWTDFISPWTDKNDEFLKCIRLAANGDKEAYSKFRSLVMEAYNASYGKLFKINSIGMGRDKMSLALQMLDSYTRMMTNYFYMAVDIQGILKDANTELTEKIREMVSDSEKPVTFKDFYDMWIKINSEAINKLYFTDDFTGFLGKFADNAYDFKKVSDEFMENMLAALPVPTNSEMKSVYKTVYDLRKEVRDLKKEIKALRDEIEGLK
jgi:hypothetical protein